MPQPTVPSKHEKKTMGSRSMSRTTHPLAWVAVRNCAVIKALDSATKAWLPMDMVFFGRRRRAARVELLSPAVWRLLTAGGASLFDFLSSHAQRSAGADVFVAGAAKRGA